ncbi:MAG: glycoside hydrolase family 3 N-terminal domain-containing protein, partial [Acidobacteriota bacterium]
MIVPALLLVFSSLLTFSQTTLTPSLPLDDGARRWVDNTLNEMTLEQKVGQLVVPGTDTYFTNLTSEKFQRVRENILRYHVGGYHAFKGDVLPAALLISRMQEMARIPLLITADLEGGAGLIFPGGTRFPKAMALGATFDPTVPYQVGQITASEARRIGVGVNFYPVVDVNNNPNNPI